MDLRKAFGVDATLEREGFELHLGGGAYITLARAGGGNVRYERAVTKHLAPHRAARDAGTLENAMADTILHNVYADAVVLDWRGIELDGEPLPYSRDNAYKLLHELPDLWRIVQDAAGKLANFRQAEVQDLGKGSEGS
jgi:hypothetical protein